ncbi:MAG: ABC transporter substrate-binding protein [Deltaproteobacteria bacterium]|nr:ABC transporter substrate-binding protein [Deltaproteobacteria bacterium]
MNSKLAAMKQIIGLLVIFVTLAAGRAPADAQQPKKVARVCYLGNGVTGTAEYIKPFQQRLRELGYVEGQNLIIDYRYFEGQIERLPGLAAEFVRLNCDVIVTQGTEAAAAAKNVIKTIPVVMAFGADAVRLGIVADLARPGGNITGLTDMGAEMYGKRLELLKETVPKLSRVAFLWSPSNREEDFNVKETEPVARFLRIGIQSLEVKGPDDIEGAFRAATKGRANGLMVPGGGFFAVHRKRIIDLVTKNRLPAMYTSVRFVESGGLMVYGEDRSEMLRRAAEIVDKVLKGTKPAEIPVERPKKFDFVINLKAAKQIGFTVPPEVLWKATRIIR